MMIVFVCYCGDEIDHIQISEWEATKWRMEQQIRFPLLDFKVDEKELLLDGYRVIADENK